MHLQLLQAVESFLTLLAGEIFLRLSLCSLAPPHGRCKFGFLQDVVTVALGSRGHGTLRQTSYMDRGAVAKNQSYVLNTAGTQGPGTEIQRETEKRREEKRKREIQRSCKWFSFRLLTELLAVQKALTSN